MINESYSYRVTHFLKRNQFRKQFRLNNSQTYVSQSECLHVCQTMCTFQMSLSSPSLCPCNFNPLMLKRSSRNCCLAF